MKRENLQRAKDAELDLAMLESKLQHFRHVQKLHISSAHCLDLQDYPMPSRLGTGFRDVRDAIVRMLESQVRDAKRELENLGVTNLELSE